MKTAAQGPLGRILAAGLANVKAPRPVMKEAIEEVGRVVAHDLERFLTTLGTIAAMSPLLGLFGTVVGMIEIFGSQTPPAANPIQLAHGISIALYNTAFGLIVAIPSMIFYRHFRARSTRWWSRWSSRRSSWSNSRTASASSGARRMNLRGTRGREEPEINFIPLIDVLLVILIFLMVTTTYQRFAELQITLPEADAERPSSGRRRSTSASTRRAGTSINKNVFTFTTVGALADVLKRAAGDAKEPVIVINADANATHQSVIHVMEAARLAGSCTSRSRPSTPAAK